MGNIEASSTGDPQPREVDIKLSYPFKNWRRECMEGGARKVNQTLQHRKSARENSSGEHENGSSSFI